MTSTTDPLAAPPAPPRRRRWLGLSLAAVLLIFALGVLLKRTTHEEGLLVFAAASTTEALQDVGQAYTAKTGQPVTFSFGGSSALARLLVAGGAADVFVSADLASMDVVDHAGLLAPGGRKGFLTNRLVVVAPRDSGLKVAGPQDLISVKRLALADPKGVPAGVYAKAWLEHVGLWAPLEPNVFPALDVRAALAAVEVGTADAAVVYQTDALVTQRVKVVYRVPVSETPAIRYAVGRLARGKKGAQAFYDFLDQERARSLFARRGFVNLDER